MTKNEKLKGLQLKILLEIRRICDKYNLHYFLDAGSMLGAVRHKGFIPWDDDIDVSMIQSDYEKFLTVAPEELREEFFIHNQFTDSDYGLVFTKIRLKGTRLVENKGSRHSIHQEISVDVFPYYFISDEESVRRTEGIQMKIFAQILLLKSGFHVWRGEGILKFFKFLPLIVMSRLCSRKWVLAKIEQLYHRHENTHRVCLHDGVSYTHWYMDRELLTEFVEVEFEGELFKIPKDYDRFLRIAYGDYMVLPPKEQQETHQIMELEFGVYENEDSQAERT